MGISTHVLDTSSGRPGAGVPVTLERRDAADGWSTVAVDATDEDGRVKSLVDDGALETGLYRIGFDTGVYWMGDFATGTLVSDVEWAERYRFWLR